MKRLFALVLGLLFVCILVGCTTEPNASGDTEGFAVEGYFLRTDTPYIVLSEENRAELGDRYMKLNNPQWLTPVNMDDLNNGDRIIARGMTIADLDPRVFDVSEITLIERGTIDNIAPSIVDELMPSECASDIITRELVSIVDKSKTMDIDLHDVEEPFYEDRQYIYIFGNPISEYVIVTYSDGSTENVKNALHGGRIALYDLDRFGIQYFAEPKLIDNIVDHAESGEFATADALEPFYSDETYAYIFPSIRSQYVIVYFKDGTEMPIREALAAGTVTIRDLDWFGISYRKEERKQT